MQVGQCCLKPSEPLISRTPVLVLQLNNITTKKSIMKKTEFYEKYGNYLKSVSNDEAEYGDHLILHPEEVNLAKEYQQQGFTIVSVHETEDGEDFVDVSQPVDFGTQPFKYGYFVMYPAK